MIQPGTLLQNRYRVTKQIGKGGMGEVYAATDERFQNTVAIKRNFFDDPEMQKAFGREARLLNHLRHNALPKVSDHFTEDGGHFLVMEFIEGSDFAELMKQRKVPFPLTDVLRWADELLDALEYLHTQETPVVHRDIKPPNIKLTPRGRIVLLDFGLAKGAPSQTASGAASSVHGFSLNFAPLEQMEGSGTGPRSDLYSLAATLYFLLTGVRPPDAVARAVASIKGRPDPLRPAHLVQPQVTAAIGQILHRAMSQNSALRQASAAELRTALRLAANDIARRAARTPLAPPKEIPQSPPAPQAAAMDEVTVRTSWLGTPGAQDLTQSSHLSQNLQPASTHGNEGAAQIDSRRPSRLYDSVTASAHAASAREGAPSKSPRVLFACLFLLCAAIGVYLIARPRGSSAPDASESAETQSPAPSSQAIAAPSSQPSAGPLYSDSSQGTTGTNAPSQAVPERAAAETASSSGSPTGGENAAVTPNSGGPDTKGSSSGAATTVSPGGVLASPTGRPGLVIQNPVPAVSAAGASRRAEEPRREQSGYPPEYTNRPPPGGYPPPPGDRRPPPPPNGRRPPPNFRPLYP
jgi:serine/threonine protein kinase